MPRFAAIDVGSNAMRLRIVEAQEPGAPRSLRGQLSLMPGDKGTSERDARGFRAVASLRAPVRLGSEVFVSGKLTPACIGQACAALREFRTAMDSANVDVYRATATSAVREAENGATLAERARREAGIELEVIEGIEEARLIQLAVVRRMGLEEKRALLVDVGGGSTELTVLDRGHASFSMSLPMGTVRLLETFLRGAKTIGAEHARLLDEAIDRALHEALPQIQKLAPFDVLVGTGGNIDTLVDISPAKGGHAGYARAIETSALRSLFGKFSKMTANERRDAWNLRPDRADTIVPANAIFLHVAETLSLPAVVAPGVGLKEGILEEIVDKYFHVWDVAGEAENVLEACVRLGRRYQFDEAHGHRVTGFATQLFDDLQSVHAFRDRDRLLLRAAAMLHDIGDFVRYDAHHKHSYYLIQHSDIMGLTPEERAIVANIARYHRKSLPDPAHPNFRDLDRDGRGKVRGLAAILRVADALDREHRGKVKSARAVVDRSAGKVRLFLRGHEDRELEEWTVRAKAELLRDVYDLDVTIADDGP
ncbi:MAG: Ppx/GppA phosphatase family protein [Polyangiaceae bacterium]